MRPEAFTPQWRTNQILDAIWWASFTRVERNRGRQGSNLSRERSLRDLLLSVGSRKKRIRSLARANFIELLTPNQSERFAFLGTLHSDELLGSVLTSMISVDTLYAQTNSNRPRR